MYCAPHLKLLSPCSSKTAFPRGVSIQKALAKLEKVISFGKFEGIIKGGLMQLDFHELSLPVEQAGFLLQCVPAMARLVT